MEKCLSSDALHMRASCSELYIASFLLISLLTELRRIYRNLGIITSYIRIQYCLSRQFLINVLA